MKADKDPLMEATEKMAEVMAGFSVGFDQLKKKIAESKAFGQAKAKAVSKAAEVKRLIDQL